MRTELIQAWHRWWRAPLANVVASCGLALGLAAAMIVHTVINGLLWQPTAVPAGERVQLIELDLSAGSQRMRLENWSYPGFLALREALAPDYSAIAVTRTPLVLTISSGADARRVAAELVSPGYFGQLGVAVLLGADFVADHDESSEDRRVWLSHSWWLEQFAGDAAVLGRAIQLQGVSFVVAGVLPPGFRGLSEQAGIWIPISAAPSVTFARRLESPTSFWHSVFVTPAAASPEALLARLDLPAARVREAIGLRIGGEAAQLRLQLKAWQASRVDPVVQRATSAIAACALLLLAIVSLNLALLALARLDQRRRELSVRVALGAGRAALLRSLFSEQLLIFGLGLAGAWLIATLAITWLTRFGDMVRIGTHSFADLQLGASTVLLGAGLALLAATVVLLGPARIILRLNAPKAVAPGAGGQLLRGRRWLVGTQFALATALAIAASFAALAAWRAVNVPLGFDPARLLTAQIAVPAALEPADGMAGFLSRWSALLQQQPGVEAVATAVCLPIRGGCDNVLIESVPTAGSSEWPVGLNLVSGDYFQALGIPLQQGRLLDERDTAAATPVVVLSAAAAQRYFPDGNALGRRIKVSIGFPENPLGALVVGVVGDVFETDLDAEPQPLVYLSALQSAYNDNFAIVRARPGIEAASLSGALNRTLAQAQPGLSLWDSATMEQRFDSLTARRRLLAGLVTALAGLAVLLAGGGIYAMFNLLVQRRQREFGVRMALGASAARVQVSVLLDALRVAAVATAAGLCLAAAGLAALGSQLPGLSGDRLPVFAAVTTLMLAILLSAGWWPARRAAGADPMTALRLDH